MGQGRKAGTLNEGGIALRLKQTISASMNCGKRLNGSSERVLVKSNSKRFSEKLAQRTSKKEIIIKPKLPEKPKFQSARQALGDPKILDSLNSFEKREILEFKEIWFTGRAGIDKMEDLKEAKLNSGFDD